MTIVMSGRKVIEILEKNGYSQISSKGSHMRMQNNLDMDLVIHVPMHRELKKGTLCSIFKKAGLEHIYKKILKEHK